ncbi:DUF5996 family protein [Marinococcus halophilus]|uniref:DUF5996 family protein n=1 Tax=Marinococcus halophilus TaxID=1371 RepID=UPI0009A577FB|nr:DUF5996 family protein [Marinococcus halophilus]
MPFKEWKDTKLTLQLLSQILGKIRLETAPQEPQWAHVMLEITPNGFSTGMLIQDGKAFELEIDTRNSRLLAVVEDTVEATKLEDGTPIQTYYEWIFSCLHQAGIHVRIYPKPQEMPVTVWLSEDQVHKRYDAEKAMKGLKMMQAAYQEELAFIGPLRGRKIKPGLFWGTFDVSTLIVENIPEPFPEEKTIEKAAFDEQFIELGFWPGDDNTDHPSFFVLPYPFQEKDLNSPAIEPKEAYYDPQASEYFLPLTDSFAGSTVQQFFRTTFAFLHAELGWKDPEYFYRPLLMKKPPTI